MTTLYEHMQLAAQERQEKYAYKIIDYFPPLTEFPNERIYLGVNSWTLPDRGERWLKPGAYYVTDFGIQTAGEIARDYLDWKFPRRLRAVREQKASLNLPRSAPLYCSPAVLEAACYVDLKGAFWSIMSLVGWNVDYYPNHWLVRGTPPNDFPYPEIKPARNALVSCGLPTPLRMWTGKKVARQFRTNLHINMGLWACIMDVLHALASVARQLEAVYIHTDGYILPQWHAETLIEFCQSFGLTASIKARGVGAVIGMGNWKVGDHSTKNYGKAYALMGTVDYIYQTDRKALQAKLWHYRQHINDYASRQENSKMRELT